MAFSSLISIVLAAAPAPSTSIACLYDAMGSAAARTAAQARRDGIESPEEQAAIERLQAQLAECEERYSWSEAQVQLVLKYTVGRADGDEAAEFLRRHDVRDGAVEAVAASLTDSERKAILASDLSVVPTVTKRIIMHSGWRFPATPTPEAGDVMQMMSTALTSLLMQRDAVAHFEQAADPPH